MSAPQAARACEHALRRGVGIGLTERRVDDVARQRARLSCCSRRWSRLLLLLLLLRLASGAHAGRERHGTARRRCRRATASDDADGDSELL